MQSYVEAIFHLKVSILPQKELYHSTQLCTGWIGLDLIPKKENILWRMALQISGHEGRVCDRRALKRKNAVES